MNDIITEVEEATGTGTNQRNFLRPTMARLLACDRLDERERFNRKSLYQWACAMMGIDPGNNPNYKQEQPNRHERWEHGTEQI